MRRKSAMRLRVLLSSILFLFSFSLTNTVFAFPSFTWIIADSTQPSPKNVGFVVSVSTEFDVSSLVFPEFPDEPRNVLTFVPIPKVPGPDVWKIGLLVFPDEIPLRGALFYTSANCSGTPWIGEFQVNGEFDPAFDPHVVIGDGINPDLRALYVADPATPFLHPWISTVLSHLLLLECVPRQSGICRPSRPFWWTRICTRPFRRLTNCILSFHRKDVENMAVPRDRHIHKS